MKDKYDVVEVIMKTSYGEYSVKVGAKDLEELKDNAIIPVLLAVGYSGKTIAEVFPSELL